MIMYNIKNNFTMHSDWIFGMYTRYNPNAIICIADLYFVKTSDCIECASFFDFDITEKLFASKFKKIKFKYINENTYKKIKDLAKNYGYTTKIIDCWDAPCLHIDNIGYINTLSYRIRRNWVKYKKTKSEYIIKNSDTDNLLKLWQDVLYVDANSWKYRAKSDMKSLNREDLQYIFYMMNNNENISLQVIYLHNEPLAYSLMFKNGAQWFAVKWGASDNGRNHDAGIKVLFSHLEDLLSKEDTLNIDFWGRRNIFYDLLKNNSIKRYHLELELNNANKN